MDLLNGSIRTLYFRYFAAAFGSACISCIYGMVDSAVVGQYHGPDGTAAIAVIMPIFNIMYSLGLFVGVGGSVLFGTERGRAAEGTDRQNEYFTAACIGAVFFSILVWIILFAFETPLLLLFGADETLLPLAQQYMLPLRFAAPVFLFSQLLAAFLRNDNAPGLAAAAVLFTGIFNVFGDFFFVFGLNMGILGAGLATAMGSAISVLVMLTHFLSKKNTLRLVRVTGFFRKLKNILVTGFSTFFTDFSLGIITMLFNRQTMLYLGSSALAVFGVLMNLNTFVQCCGYSVGQAAQPIISMSYGAGQTGRIRDTLKYALGTALFLGVLWLVLIMGFPNAFVRLFMSPTEEVLSIAPAIIRTYGSAFLFVPFTVFSTYYFQSIMKPADAFVISLSRGLVISGILILLLPGLFGADALWLAMPVAEGLTAVCAAVRMVHHTVRLRSS